MGSDVKNSTSLVNLLLLSLTSMEPKLHLDVAKQHIWSQNTTWMLQKPTNTVNTEMAEVVGKVDREIY